MIIEKDKYVGGKHWSSLEDQPSYRAHLGQTHLVRINKERNLQPTPVCYTVATPADVANTHSELICVRSPSVPSSHPPSAPISKVPTTVVSHVPTIPSGPSWQSAASSTRKRKRDGYLNGNLQEPLEYPRGGPSHLCVAWLQRLEHEAWFMFVPATTPAATTPTRMQTTRIPTGSHTS